MGVRRDASHARADADEQTESNRPPPLKIARANCFQVPSGDVTVPGIPVGQQKGGNVFRVGICLDFVKKRRSGATRAEGPHGAHVRGAKRNRIGRPSAHR